jgi:hypothetical protein
MAFRTISSFRIQAVSTTFAGSHSSGPATRILRRRSRVQHSLYGVNTRIFSDVAKEAARIAANQSAFGRIYPLIAWEPELEAYEVFPVFATCK